MTKPRWQAGYDLAIGRALAVKVRTEELFREEEVRFVPLVRGS